MTFDRDKNQWIDRWEPALAGTQTHRLEYMLQLRAAIATFLRRTTVWMDQDTILRILERGVLNCSQIANLLEISRPTVYEIARGVNHLHIPAPRAPRGKIDRYDLDLMYLLVQQLTLGRRPQEFLLEALPYCGDISIVSYLTGVPKSTIYRYRRSREVSDGIDYRKRIVNDPELLESLGGQVR